MAVYIENFRNRVIKKLNFSHYNGEEERTETIPAGGSTCLKQLKENIEYTVGIHADVTEDTPIKLTTYDGEERDAEVIGNSITANKTRQSIKYLLKNNRFPI